MRGWWNLLTGSISLRRLLLLSTAVLAIASLNAQGQGSTITASQLAHNMSTQLAAGNFQAALVVGRTLVTRFPNSPEGIAAKKQMEEIQTKLNAAMSEADKKQATEYKRLIRSMRSHEDVVEHITFFTHRAFPESTGSFVSLYIGRSGKFGPPYLRTRLQYGGSDWIFFNTVKFSVDGTTLADPQLGHIERDNGYGSVWEWVDMSVADDALPLFNALANGKQVIVRFEGKYRKDLTLSSGAKAGLRDTLRLYQLMKQGVQG